jgi:integrase/recombinase XerD
LIAPVGQKIIQEFVDNNELYAEDFLFSSIRGGKIATTSMSRLITNLMRKAGINDTSSHSARKSYATGLLSLGLSLPQISSCLNHAQISTTIRYLGNHEPDIKNAVKNLKF